MRWPEQPQTLSLTSRYDAKTRTATLSGTHSLGVSEDGLEAQLARAVAQRARQQ